MNKFIKLLLVIGCFVSSANLHAIGLESTEEGQAFETGNLKRVKEILEKDNIFTHPRETLLLLQALELGIRSGNLELVKYLALKGWLTTCKNNQNDCFPIHHASSKTSEKSIPIIEFLIDNGFNPNIATNYGMTTLHYAAQRGDITLVQYLCDIGVDADIKNSYSETVAQIAERYVNAVDSSLDSKENEHRRNKLRNVINYLKSGKCIKK